MPKPQSFRRIIVEDYPEKDRPLVGKLAYSVNSFADDMLQMLNNNLSVRDNLAAEQKTFTVTCVAGVPTKQLSILTGLSSQCGGCQVINAVNNTVLTHTPTGMPFMSFTNNAGSILISKITGLQDSEQYTLTVIMWPV